MQSLQRRKFTDSEKRSIVDEAARRGINVVLQEYRLSYSVFSRWKQKFQPEEVNEQKEKNKILQQIKDLVI